MREIDLLRAARQAGAGVLECSLDLRRSTSVVEIGTVAWSYEGRQYPYPLRGKERTVYHWTPDGFAAVARFSSSLIKLVPTEWGAPTFEIDGIKMLPTSRISPYADAEQKVALVRPQGKVVLDTCGGLGYFAAWCLDFHAAHVHSYEKSDDVIWLRSINPWSPAPAAALTLTRMDVVHALTTLPAASVDAVLHDPPRFGIAGELYSQSFYAHLARVLKRKGRLFHYTGHPNKLGGGRDLPNEVSNRLRIAGFAVAKTPDGVLAVKK